MTNIITYVGLDVHKLSISVAVADEGLRGEACHVGVVDNTEASLSRLAGKLSRSGRRRLHFCYEAGPCGYGVYRHLVALGHDCAVVAPSLIPRKPGDRVKTDRRDALLLARLHRAGELTAVWVPDPDHEAMRDLVRARAVSVRALRRGTPAIRRLFVAPRPGLHGRQGLDASASALAVDAGLHASGATDCVSGLHPYD